jgi:hypothetical protein
VRTYNKHIELFAVDDTNRADHERRPSRIHLYPRRVARGKREAPSEGRRAALNVGAGMRRRSTYQSINDANGRHVELERRNNATHVRGANFIHVRGLRRTAKACRKTNKAVML